DWIQAAIMGILLLAGAYFILKVINPNLVNLTLPDNLQSVGKTNTGTGTGGTGGTGGTTTGGSGTGLSQSAAQQELTAAGIGVSSSGNCSDASNPNCTSLQGMRQDTINELISLKSDCGCTITVTGGTEVGHAAGDESHSTGYKADINPTSQVSNYITTNFKQIANRSSDGAQQWVDGSTGAVYARESNHWDISVP
ncbi:MAG: hypothetical protein P4M10_07970, partial [Verrucomicrobiae bacterium]|nr:hypothetical protein [Verrucomicrobiae bacterium]